MLKGDIGLFRGALFLAGFFRSAECNIFNDRHKDGTRRLKLWFADSVHDAQLPQQQALWEALLGAYGQRIRVVEFTEDQPRYGRSLLVHLHN